MPTFTTRPSVLGAVLAILVAIAASFAVVAASGTANAASMTKCGRWAQHQYTRSRQCIRVSRIDSILNKTDSYLLHNSHHHQAHPGELQLDARDDLDLARGRIREG